MLILELVDDDDEYLGLKFGQVTNPLEVAKTAAPKEGRRRSAVSSAATACWRDCCVLSLAWASYSPPAPARADSSWRDLLACASPPAARAESSCRDLAMALGAAPPSASL